MLPEIREMSSEQLREILKEINAFNTKALADIQKHQQALNEKMKSINKLKDNIGVLLRALEREKNEQVVALAKIRQLKEAVNDTENLISALDPDLQKIQKEIADIKNEMGFYEEDTKKVIEELQSRGKVIPFDRKRSEE